MLILSTRQKIQQRFSAGVLIVRLIKPPVLIRKEKHQVNAFTGKTIFLKPIHTKQNHLQVVVKAVATIVKFTLQRKGYP